MPEQIKIQKGQAKDGYSKSIKQARGSPITPEMGDVMRFVGKVTLSRKEQGRRGTYPK